MTVKCVTVVFQGTLAKGYSYFVPEGDEPQLGDTVVTSFNLDQLPGWDGLLRAGSFAKAVAGGAQQLELKLATVVELHAEVQPRATKAYLYLIPLEVLKQRKQEAVALAEKVKRQAEARTKLRAKLDDAVLITLAKQHGLDGDPELADLVKQLEA